MIPQIRMCALLSIESWAAAKKKLAPSVTSVANDKGDNEKIPGAVHRSPGIYLTAE